MKKPLVLAEFETPEELLEAARRMRADGHELEDAYTPCRVEGLEEILGLRRTRIPWLVLGAGLVAAVLAYLLQWWITVVDYPLNVGGRPLHSAPAFVPISFEMAILFGALAGFAALFVAGGMPKLWDPVFEVEGFERASVDRYWLAVADGDGGPAERLESLGALRVVRLGESGVEGEDG